jgi:uncharacterized protein (TIRG00374 family)
MWKVALRIIISVIAIAIVFHEIDWSQFFYYLVNINRGWYILAIAIQILSALFAAYKWKMIMTFMGYHPNFKFYAQSYLVGTLFNQVLPTSVGGDAVRVADAHKLGAGLRKSFYGVMVDRYYGTAGLVLLNFIPLYWLWGLLPHPIYWAIVVIITGASLALLFALVLGKLHFLNRFKLTQVFYELSQAIVANAHTVRRISVLLLLAMLTNFLTIFSLFLIARAINLDISLMDLLGIVPAITLITLLPISFAGWGIREGAMVSFLLFLHLPKTAIISLSVLYGLMLILASLPGLYFYLFRRSVAFQHNKP